MIPSRLYIEITETMAIRRHGPAVAALEALSEAGVRIALDDLGVGHASMAALSGVPVSTVKLDRSIAAGIGMGVGAEQQAGAIAAICLLHGRQMVAEGIETPAQATFFRELGCEWGQGYHFGRPVPAETLLAP